ncbi:MAG: hypothetical protein EB084_17770 [Proteobacteria bacterium]|nr:hypothetical protein [Pseudomonadota bacterium]
MTLQTPTSKEPPSLMDPAFVRTLTFVLIAVVGATFGDTLLSIGMRRVGELGASDVRSVATYFWRALTHPYVAGGIACMSIYFFTWLVVLSEADLSLALPLTALTFVLGTVLARWWLHETVTPARWFGTGVIAIGVVIVALTGTHQISSAPEKQGQETAPPPASVTAEPRP